MIIYIDGVRLVDLSADAQPASWANINGSGKIHKINSVSNSAAKVSGYYAQHVFVDGLQLDPTSFGEINSFNRFVPIDVSGLTFGNNGHYLKFENGANLGEDSSGNGNDWTNTNVTQSSDSPTRNLAVLNQLFTDGGVAENITNGNLKYQPLGTNQHNAPVSTLGIASGKFYIEANIIVGDGVNGKQIGIIDEQNFKTGAIDLSQYTKSTIMQWTSGSATIKRDNSTTQSSLLIALNGDVIGMAIDMDGKTIQFSVNGVNTGTAESFTGTNAFVGMSANVAANGCTFVFSENDWTHTAPSGFVELAAANLPAPTVNPAANFYGEAYTGDGVANRAFTGIGFNTDWLWFKRRNGANPHLFYDSVRGNTKELNCDVSIAETTTSDFTSFDSDGFTLGVASADINTNLATYVAFAWKANGSTVVNNDGTIQSNVSANTASGVSLVSFVGNATAGATIGHGLGKKPDVFFIKNRQAVDNWPTYFSVLGATKHLFLDDSAVLQTATNQFNDTEPTASVLTVGGIQQVNGSGQNMIVYCFTEIIGFSKFSEYVGNGSTDGTFVFLGFRPRWLLIKRRDINDSWRLFDTERDPDNQVDKILLPDSSAAEFTGATAGIDFLSNGFKLRGAESGVNASTNNYVYMAFAQNPFSRGS
ncbi:MAG: hypothetical protein HOG49_21505 [Candidatus Scalindua sp.]|nr:hypothetical protein [Candidatus Scalindua sp.]